MQVWKKPLLLLATVAGALSGAPVAFAQGGPASDQTVKSIQAQRPPFIIEEGPVETITYPDGTTEQAPTSTVTRFICGTDTTNLTVADLRRIDAIAAESPDKEPLLITGSGLRGGLSITFNVTLGSPPAAALARLSDISTFFNSLFSDPVTITINVRWLNLSPGVLGSTASSYSGLIYSSVQSQLVADMDADDVIQYFVPNTTSLGVVYDANTGTVTNESVVFVTFANREALGANPPNPAATMNLSSSIPWDFDESDGVTPGTLGLESVIIHEVGHALGFTSGVGFRNNDIEMMDIYRFDRSNAGLGFNPTTFHEFETGPRLADFANPNNRHTTEMISVDYRMEDGNPYQASHLREQLGTPLGLMDPVVSSGESFWPDFFKASDIDILDAIGWDIIIGPCTTLGDVDMDGDVDLRDVQKFQDCFDPTLPTAAGCECADVDQRDDRVNLFDWEVMERALMTGP